VLAEDLDVSGDLDPFLRPELGEWLKHPDDWDGLIWAVYDRCGRNPSGFLGLDKWLRAHGKA
jgi:hypothetical protein